MGTFLFGCVVFFSIAGIVMFLDRKKEQKEGPTGNETQVGEPVGWGAKSGLGNPGA